MALTKDDIAKKILGILGELSGQTDGADPWAAMVRAVKARGTECPEWATVDALPIIRWWNDDPCGYPDLVANDFKQRIDQFIEADSETVPSAETSVGWVVANAFNKAP